MKHSPKFEKLKHEKKMKGDVLTGAHKKAKEEGLSNLIDDMMGMDSDKVKGLKKVTVAAKSKHDLEKGLDVAKDVLHGKLPEESEGMEESPEMESEETPEHEAEESPEMEASEHEEESLEEKDQKIAELEEKLAQLEEKLNKLM